MSTKSINKQVIDQLTSHAHGRLQITQTFVLEQPWKFAEAIAQAKENVNNDGWAVVEVVSCTTRSNPKFNVNYYDVVLQVNDYDDEPF